MSVTVTQGGHTVDTDRLEAAAQALAAHTARHLRVRWERLSPGERDVYREAAAAAVTAYHVGAYNEGTG